MATEPEKWPKELSLPMRDRDGPENTSGHWWRVTDTLMVSVVSSTL